MENVKSKGTFVAAYNIKVLNAGVEKTKGPFKIKIKLTEEMKKYNSFKLIYFTEDITAGDSIELTKEGLIMK